MNFKLLVKSSGGITLHEPSFNTLEELEQMKQLFIDKNDWKFPTRSEVLPASEAELDEQGVIISPALPERTVLVLDVTFETLNLTSINEELAGIAKNEARIQFGMKLMAELAYRNKKRLLAGLTTVTAIFVAEDKLKNVQRLLLNSSTEKALQDLSILDVSEIPDDEKLYFLNKIQTYLEAE